MGHKATDLPSQVAAREIEMRRRIRKLVGAVVMLAFVAFYAAVAMLVAQTDHIRHAPAVPQALFFLVVGLAWVLPLMPLIRWMERPNADDWPSRS